MDSGISAAAPAGSAALAQTTAPPRRLSHLGDELLARYASRGSERAFAVLYERYYQKLYRYCRSILRNDPDAQDALQATFTNALVALRHDQRTAPLRPWLYRIAHNEAISLLRRRGRQPTEELHAETFGTVSSAEQEVADRVRWRTLVQDLGRLSERQRGALLLRELSGLTHEEIAIALVVTTPAAKQAIFEARQALAELEEGRAMSCEDVRRRISEGDRRVLKGRRVRAHLRACSGCEAFAVAIPGRRAELRALTPVLPPAAAAMLLNRSLSAASSHGGVGGASVAGAGGSASSAGGASASGVSGGAATAAGATGKAIGTALVWKGLAGAALLATAAAGATGVTQLLQHHHPVRLASAAHLRSHDHGASAAAGGGTSGAATSPSTSSGPGLAGRGHGGSTDHGASDVRGGGSHGSHGKASKTATGGSAGNGGGHAYGRQGQSPSSPGHSSGSPGRPLGHRGSHHGANGSAGGGLGLHVGSSGTHVHAHRTVHHVSVTKHLTTVHRKRRTSVGTLKPSR